MPVDLKGKPLAFIDLETTGFRPGRDDIIEMAIIQYDGAVISSWSQLIQPEVRVPESVSRLTGIHQDMLAGQPRFTALAALIAEKLSGHILVAHNARFDCAFLKRALAACGIRMPLPAICTVKLSRALFPLERKHDLDALVERHQMDLRRHHRALADAEILLRFWQTVVERLPEHEVLPRIQQQLRNPSIPPHLDPAHFHGLPDCCGVYIFRGRDGIPIYVGKSLNLRKRVLSHFSADARHDRALSMTQQILHIETIPCRSEMEALLLEAQIVKQLQPVFNRQLRSRKSLVSWRLHEGTDTARPVMELVRAHDLSPGRQPGLHGLFRNAVEARKSLERVVLDHQLCPVVTGLEKGVPGRPCFSRQLKRCRGACCGEETFIEHKNRLAAAMDSFRLEVWPWAGPALLEDSGCCHVVDAWCYLGTLDSGCSATEISRVLQQARPVFDHDIYRILVKQRHRLRAFETGNRIKP